MTSPGQITAEGQRNLDQAAAEQARRHIATDARMEFERRKDLFEFCGPTEQREIASRYQLDHTFGVALARRWAAKWRESRGRAFWHTPGRKIA